MELRLALTTAPTTEVAERLVRTLVEERIIACGNVVPGVTSVFHWQGALEREAEVLVLMKTTAPAVSRLSSRLVELHPYEVPELLVLGVDAAHAAYGAWVAGNVSPTGEG